MINRKRRQEAMEKVVAIKKQLKNKETELKTAYFEYYIADGKTIKQAERLI